MWAAPGKERGKLLSERVWDILVNSFTSILIPGLTATIPLTVISFAIALVIATATALVQFAGVPVLKQLARFYIWVVRGTPLLVQLYVVFYGLPDLGVLLNPFPAAVIVFSINTGAYAAESIRAALEAVPRGQIEAGYCVGMTYAQVMRRIVLPQAMRTAFPPLSNELIALVKDTSLAANITVLEMLMATQQIISRTYEALPLYLEVALIYLLFSTVRSMWARRNWPSVGQKGGRPCPRNFFAWRACARRLAAVMRRACLARKPLRGAPQGRVLAGGEGRMPTQWRFCTASTLR